MRDSTRIPGNRRMATVLMLAAALSAVVLSIVPLATVAAQEDATPTPAATDADASMEVAGRTAEVVQAEPATLTVVGEAEERLTPDIATVTLGVQTTGKTAGETIQANSQKMAAVLAAIKALGIPEEHVQTTRISLRPVYAPRRRRMPETTPTGPTIIGYEATNTVAVRVADIEKVGDVLDTGLDAGANQVGGIRFGLQDTLKPYLDALAAATRLARQKADVMAAAAGLVVVDIVSISEESRGGPPIPLPRGGGGFAVAEAAVRVPVEAGEVVIQARVRIEYRLGRVSPAEATPRSTPSAGTPLPTPTSTVPASPTPAAGGR